MHISLQTRNIENKFEEEAQSAEQDFEVSPPSILMYCTLSNYSVKPLMCHTLPWNEYSILC
jgi:hypothetical protein